MNTQVVDLPLALTLTLTLTQVVDLTLTLTLTLTQVVDFGDINDAIKTGIDQTMALSTLSMPLALAVLGFMLRNVRPLPSALCPLPSTLYPLCTSRPSHATTG